MLTFLLAAALVQAGPSAADAQPERLGSFTLPGIRIFAAARGGTCMGVVTESRAVAVGISGDTLWDAALAESVSSLDKIAIAPSCDWLAVADSESARIQIVGRDGFRVIVPLVRAAADQVERRTWAPRSIDISADAQWLVVGTEHDHIAVITRRGVLTKQITVSEIGQPVIVEFARDTSLLLVTAYYAVGVVRANGEWLWRREVHPAEIRADQNHTSFAGKFVTSHGPADGTVEMLDARGKTRWIRDGLWDPAIAVAPNGSWIAFTASAVGYENRLPIDSQPVPSRSARLLRNDLHPSDRAHMMHVV